MLRQSLAFVAAASMAASPVLAQSSAAPLSISARAGADTGDGNDLVGRGGWFPPLLFATIVILGALTATGVIFDDDNDLPDSP